MSGFAKANTRIGYAQVEPNHLSGIVEGKILAQLPVDTTTMGEVIEQGRFAKYNYAENKVDLSEEAGEWMLIYNEEYLPDERKQNHKDFALVKSDYISGQIYPRLISTEVGDIYTTNAIGEGAFTVADINKITNTTEADITSAIPTVGDVLYVQANGYLGASEVTGVPAFKVVKVYNLADQQPAVKLMRIK